MSILLEALRKSEKRRRGGAVPTIHGDDLPPPATPERRGLGGYRWLLLALPLAAVATWWFWPANRSTSPVAEPPAAVPAGAREADSLSGNGDPGERIAASRPAMEPPTVSVVPGADGVSPGSVPRSPVERLPDPPATVSTSPSSSPAAGSQDREPVTSADRPPVSRPEPIAAAPVELLSGGRTATPPAPLERAEAGGRDALERPVTERPPTERPPIELWELPRGVRDTLPPLDLTVLVFAAEPADRFVLMDGKRLAEGDSLGPELSVQEIRRDGAVLRHGAYRFLVRND